MRKISLDITKEFHIAVELVKRMPEKDQMAFAAFCEMFIDDDDSDDEYDEVMENVFRIVGLVLRELKREADEQCSISKS